MIFIYLQRQCFVPWIAALSKFWTNVDQESFVNFELKLFQLRLFLTLRTHDHRKYPKTVTGHVI